jgi:2'-5' RNA ligase
MYGELGIGKGHCSALDVSVDTHDLCDLWEKRNLIEKAVVLVKAVDSWDDKIRSVHGGTSINGNDYADSAGGPHWLHTDGSFSKDQRGHDRTANIVMGFPEEQLEHRTSTGKSVRPSDVLTAKSGAVRMNGIPNNPAYPGDGMINATFAPHNVSKIQMQKLQRLAATTDNFSFDALDHEGAVIHSGRGRRELVQTPGIEHLLQKAVVIEVLMKAHDYASTQVNLPDDIRDRIAAWSTKHIPDKDLADKGREPDSHITVKYGIEDKGPQAIEALVKSHRQIRAKLGKLSIFKTNPEYDVLIIEVDSPDCANLNRIITRNVPCTTTFPVYIPHCTIAYVKKGAADKLNGNNEFGGTELEFPELTFSSKADKLTKIPFDKSWKAVDMDATLAHYDGFKGHEHIGEPIAPMVNRVKRWLRQGKDVRIFTARASDPKAIPPIKAWCKEHIGQELPVTNVKDHNCVSIHDDRATGVEKNTGRLIRVTISKAVPGAMPSLPPAQPHISVTPSAIHAPAPHAQHAYGQSSETHAYQPKPLFEPHETYLPKPVQPTNDPSELWKQGKVADEALHEALNRKQGYSTHAKMPVVDAGAIPNKNDNPIGHNTWHEHAKAAMNHPKGAVMFGPLKGQARAQEKAEADRKSPDEPLPYNSILDVSRATVMADKHADLHEHLKQVRHHMAKHGFVLTRAKDKYQHPDEMGYRHALTNWTHKPTGHTVEIQFSDRDMQAAKDGPGHKHYEQGRQIEDKARAEKRDRTPEEEEKFLHHAKAQQQIYGDAWQSQLRKHEMSKAVRRSFGMDHSKSIYGYYSYEGRPAVIHPRKSPLVWTGHHWQPHNDTIKFVHSADRISSAQFHRLIVQHKATIPK